jgi:transposase
MRGKRRQFSREFKMEAVRVLAESGRPLSQVARELALRPEQLREWRRQLGTETPVAPASTETEELRRLRRELEITRQERDFLKNWARARRATCWT